MRHAKASWDNASISDFDRPLNQKGLQAAPLMGNIIYKNGFQIDLIISSPAKRAKQTATLVKSSAGIVPLVEFEKELYEASPITLLKIISGIHEKHESVLLIGHNPGIQSLIRMLTGEIQSMPTASLARILLSVNNWSDIAENCGLLDVVIRPINLMEKGAIREPVLC